MFHTLPVGSLNRGETTLWEPEAIFELQDEDSWMNGGWRF